MDRLILRFLRLTPSNLSNFLFEQRKLFVFALNIGIILCSLVFAIIIRFEFSIPRNYTSNAIKIISIFILVKMLIYHFCKLNEGIWRYISIVDIKRVINANIYSSLILILIFYKWRVAISNSFGLSIIIIDFLLCTIAMSSVRVFARLIREISDGAECDSLIRTVVVGKLEDVDAFLHSIKAGKTKRKVVAIFGTGPGSSGTIRGVQTRNSLQNVAQYVKKNNIKEIILIPPYSRKRFLNLLLRRLEKINYNCLLKIIPGANHIANDEINLSSMREVEIDDLLGRPPVKFDHAEVSSLIFGKNIMITGGGGSIGRELCFQICAYNPKTLIIFEFSEFNLYEIERKLKQKFPDQKIEAVLGDIRFKNSILAAIKTHSVEIIYHAAAYKHVPLLEKNIAMGFHTNIIGTSNLADCAEECGVKRVVIISTDKAVRPTSIMGSTKRIAERVILERGAKGTEFVAVRFGNVLGSRGSVVPLFKQQIKDGGPVTVTSKNMVRYFMSIPEAVELVLQAGTIGKDRDIMILEMGKQINIYEMAKRLIELSGFMPHRDIQIVFTGIRPGEKEYEELLTNEEEVDNTPLNRIFVARKQNVVEPEVSLNDVTEAVNSRNSAKLKNLCISYISENMLGK